MLRSLAIRHDAYGRPWSSTASCCHLCTALRRAIRSLKKAGPGSLRRPSARSSGLSHTKLGAATTRIGSASGINRNPRPRTEQRLGIKPSPVLGTRAHAGWPAACAGTSRSWHSAPAEPVVALLFPIAGIPVVDDRHLHDVLGVLEPELGRDAHLHGEAVLRRQNLAVELEGHLRLRVQRGRHVDRGVIALGAAEPDIFGGEVGADPAQEFGQPRARPLADRAPALDADMASDLGLLGQLVELLQGPALLVFDQAADLE